MNVYITQQGDTFDSITRIFLGDEYLLVDLVEANQKYRKMIVFPEGVELVLPEVEIEEDSETPDWLLDDDELVDGDSIATGNEDGEGSGNEDDE